MSEIMPFVLEYYDREVVKLICDKYGIEPMAALRRFLFSESWRMLANPALEMWDFSPAGIFDMWESEQVTGGARNSAYLRED